jgi:hypothetical protein
MSDKKRLMDMYGCHDEQQLLDLLVKAELERLRYEELRHEFEDLIVLDSHTPEQRERIRVLDVSLNELNSPHVSVAMAKAERFIRMVTDGLSKKMRHGEGE